MSQTIRAGGVGFVLAAYLVEHPGWTEYIFQAGLAPAPHSWPFVMLALGISWIVAGFLYPVIENFPIHTYYAILGACMLPKKGSKTRLGEPSSRTSDFGK